VNPYLYLDRDTFMHRLDPRTKIFLLLGTFVLVFIYLDPLFQAVLFGVVLFVGYLSQMLVNLKRIWFILVMISVMTVILWSLFGSGETPLFLFLELESLLYGLAIALRIVIAIVAGMIFLSTTRNEEIAIGLVRLGIPYRFAFAVSTALRLVPTIAATGMTIAQAQRSRGLDLDAGNILQRIRKNIPLLIPVFVSTIRSTNVFSMALESKGFGAEKERTFLMELKITRRDVLAMVLFTLLLSAAIAIRLAGYGGLEGFTR
jgi:energy-coupling factor transport system permease protein